MGKHINTRYFQTFKPTKNLTMNYTSIFESRNFSDDTENRASCSYSDDTECFVSANSSYSDDECFVSANSGEASSSSSFDNGIYTPPPFPRPAPLRRLDDFDLRNNQKKKMPDLGATLNEESDGDGSSYSYESYSNETDTESEPLPDFSNHVVNQKKDSQSRRWNENERPEQTYDDFEQARSLESMVASEMQRAESLKDRKKVKTFRKTRRLESRSRAFDRSPSVQTCVKAEHDTINSIMEVAADQNGLRGRIGRFLFGWRFFLPDNEAFRSSMRRNIFGEGPRGEQAIMIEGED